jgi:hypothetical protein
LNIYGMNPVDVFATVKIHRKHYRSCVTHLCTCGTTSHKPLSNDWLVLCVGDAKLSLLQEVFTHVTELCKPPYCVTISVCPWFILIMMLRNLLILPYLLCPYESKLFDFCRFFFSLCKKYWASNPYIVSFVD